MERQFLPRDIKMSRTALWERTEPYENTMATRNIVNHYAGFYYAPPLCFSLRCAPFFERKMSAPFSLRPLADGKKDGSAPCRAAMVVVSKICLLGGHWLTKTHCLHRMFKSWTVLICWESPLGKRNHPHQTCVFKTSSVFPQNVLRESPRDYLSDTRYRPKGVSAKASAIARMRQKYVRNAAKMRQKCVKNASKWVLFYWEKRNVPKCVRNASKMRGTPLGENTFWTIPRYPPVRAMGFFNLVSQHGPIGWDRPPIFPSLSPLESMRSGGAIPPHKRGISAIFARYPVKTRKTHAIPPSAILSRKGIARYGGGYLTPGR